ncbi:MAG: hypothetical protein GY845_39075 [Planctomycetes bacterium]|nr:hypothetical protein [Planctomycetota bacterium]
MDKEIEAKTSKGGKARAKSLDQERRKEIAQKAANARWKNEKSIEPSEAVAIHPYTELGKLKIGDIELPCAVLENRIPVISYPSVTKKLGRVMGGKQRKLARSSKHERLPDFLYGTALEPFVSESLRVALNNPIVFRVRGGKRKGVNANLIPEICEVWLNARDAGALQPSQEKIARNADILMRGFARVGITALIYEATGYELIKDRDELERILAAYIAEELLPWTKRFPDEFYEQLFRLKGWQYRPMSVKRPKIVGKLTNELIYEKLPDGVIDELRGKNPVTLKGYRKYHHHQFLTEDIGNPHLEKQVAAVTTLMKASSNWSAFTRLFNRVFGTQTEMIFPELEN